MSVEVAREELFGACAIDPILYCHQFFPKAFRQASPPFHEDYWKKIEDPSRDHFGAEMFRGSAKTTLARAALTRRIAYGFSRNILLVAISESMAINTMRWLKRQVEFNLPWTTTYGLQPGGKWADDWLEVTHRIFEHSVSVVAKGMTSGLRGLNLDDWRPDFIYCDDICDEENTATPEQRAKTSGLFFGALVPSLAAKVEAPHRKIVLTQTALHKDDCISQAHKDPSFHTVRYPKIYQDHEGEWHSAWPELYPLPAVLEEKASYIKRRQVHIWLREYECKLVSAENAAFDVNWLKYTKVLPVGLRVFVGIDPASSDKKSAHKTAIGVIGEREGQIYLLDYLNQVGKNPEEIWDYLVRIVRQWHPIKVGSESIAYQKMLAWYLREKMRQTGIYFNIEEVSDRRSKPDRIRQAFTGIASNGALWVNENHTDFISEFAEYTDKVDFELLDAVAQALGLANPWMVDMREEDQEYLDGLIIDESGIPDLRIRGGCP